MLNLLAKLCELIFETLLWDEIQRFQEKVLHIHQILQWIPILDKHIELLWFWWTCWTETSSLALHNWTCFPYWFWWICKDMDILLSEICRNIVHSKISWLCCFCLDQCKFCLSCVQMGPYIRTLQYFSKGGNPKVDRRYDKTNLGGIQQLHGQKFVIFWHPPPPLTLST